MKLLARSKNYVQKMLQIQGIALFAVFGVVVPTEDPQTPAATPATAAAPATAATPAPAEAPKTDSAKTAAPKPDAPATTQASSAEKTLMVYVANPESLEVLVNGTLVGTSPILLSELPKGNVKLAVRSADSYAEKAFANDGSVGGIQVWSAELKPLTGSISIQATADGANVSISIDGVEAGTGSTKKDSIRVGPHVISLSGGDVISVQETVNIEAGKKLELTYNVKRGYPLVFTSSLPADAAIETIGTDGSVLSSQPYSRSALFAGGMTTFRIKSGIYRDFIINVDPAKGEKIDLLSFAKNAGVSLPKFKSGDVVIVDGQDLSSRVKDAKIALIPGVHTISIERTGFVKAESLIMIPGQGFTTFDPDLRYSAAYANAQKQGTSTAFILTGLGIAAAGVVLDIDPVSMALTNNYNDYVIMKYAGLGTMSLGAIVSLIALIFSF